MLGIKVKVKKWVIDSDKPVFKDNDGHTCQPSKLVPDMDGVAIGLTARGRMVVLREDGQFVEYDLHMITGEYLAN